ncbi:hypothetical protein M758_12G042900 [Ceratodon purpureus]|nr:hypothetical protein M758_12G042900 [Ceratodon purpureus]
MVGRCGESRSPCLLRLAWFWSFDSAMSYSGRVSLVIRLLLTILVCQSVLNIFSFTFQSGVGGSPSHRMAQSKSCRVSSKFSARYVQLTNRCEYFNESNYYNFTTCAVVRECDVHHRLYSM